MVQVPNGSMTTQTLSQAQALEAQIQMQTLTVEDAERYFGSEYYAHNLYATATQIIQLSHKHRYAVKGLNPFEKSNEIYKLFDDNKPVEKLEVPKPQKCKFCGTPLDYIGIIRNGGATYEREVVRWSKIPTRCSCDKATAHWAAADAEEKRCKEEEQRQREEEARKSRIERLRIASSMKPRFLSRTFANFRQDTPGRAKAYKAAKEYADNFAARHANGDGLYIEGTYGTGKTHLAAAIAIQLMEQEHMVIFKSADELLRDIKETFDGKGEEKAVLNKLTGCDLLVIDDLGKELATDWSTSILNTIINERYERLKPIIITTNFNEKDLMAIESPKGVGDHRIRAILSRLHETCRLMTMNWQDWRGTQ